VNLFPLNKISTKGAKNLLHHIRYGLGIVLIKNLINFFKFYYLKGISSSLLIPKESYI